MKDGFFQLRTDERFDALQRALEKRGIGKTKAERVMMGLECLRERYDLKVPA